MRRRFLLSLSSAPPSALLQWRPASGHGVFTPAPQQTVLLQLLSRAARISSPLQTAFSKNSPHILHHVKFYKAVKQSRSGLVFLMSIFLICIFLLRYRLGLMRNLCCAMLILHKRQKKNKPLTKKPLCHCYMKSMGLKKSHFT